MDDNSQTIVGRPTCGSTVGTSHDEKNTHTYLHKLIYITHIQQPLYSACNLDTKVHIIDTLTKPVPKQRFGTLRGQMGLQQMTEQRKPNEEQKVTFDRYTYYTSADSVACRPTCNINLDQFCNLCLRGT